MHNGWLLVMIVIFYERITLSFVLTTSQDGYCPHLRVPIFVFVGVLSTCRNPMFGLNHCILSFVKQESVIVTCSEPTNASLLNARFESQYTTIIHASNTKNNAKYHASK